MPRHLHRYVLRLLRPAEAATRRLIIVAAYGLKVEISALRQRKPKPLPQPRTVYVLDRVNGSIVSVPMVVEETVQVVPSDHGAKRAISVTFPLFDPAMRFWNRRRSVRPATMPSISLIGGDPRIPASLQLTERPRRPLPPPPSEDDEIDAMRLHRRLEAIDRALGDLPGQAYRFARWHARRDAILARRHAGAAEGSADSGGPVANGLAHRGQAGKKKRFQRFELMRPGRPPGWRRKPTHDVDFVLKELHGLAVWTRERRDSS